MNRPFIVFWSLFAIFLVGCSSPTAYRADETEPPTAVHGSEGALSLLGEPQGQVDPRLACSSERPCFHTGCFGEVCGTEEIVTSCEFRCESGVLRTGALRLPGNPVWFPHEPGARGVSPRLWSTAEPVSAGSLARSPSPNVR